MSTTTETTKIATAALAGAAGGYFLDPQNGRRRRHIARDRALAMVREPARRAADEAQRKASYAQGIVRGAAHRATSSGERRDPARLNDPALEAKVESEIFGDPEAPKDAVNVNVEAGIVYLRGEVESHGVADRLVSAALAVEGVGQVRSLLHLPGEAPPPKESAPSASA